MKPAKITLSVILFVLALPIVGLQLCTANATTSFIALLEEIRPTNFSYSGIEVTLLSAQLLMLAELFTWLISFPLCITTGILVLVGIKKRRYALLCGILLAIFFILNCITGVIHYFVVYISDDINRYILFTHNHAIYDTSGIALNYTSISNVLLFAPMIGFIICGILDKKFNKTNKQTFSQPAPEQIVTTPVALDKVPTSTPATVTSPVNDEESVKKLKVFKDLLDQGIITQEEFDTKKKQLLDL